MHVTTAPGASAVATTLPVDKRFATAQAHAMWFHGVTLAKLEADDGAPLFVATLGAKTKSFRTISETEGWLHALDELDELDVPRREVALFISTQRVPERTA